MPQLIDEERARRATLAWLETLVIGLNLCPFAAKPYREGRVHLRISHATGFEQALDDLLEEVDALLDPAFAARSTTLVVYPAALDTFEEFLDAIAAVEQLLEQSEADAFLQLAHFHPHYLFEQSAPEDQANHTNRAPYPTLHLLRTEEVAEAIMGLPGVEEIPDRNIKKMRDLSPEALGLLRARYAP